MTPLELRTKLLKCDQAELAEKLGCSVPTVSMIENGLRTPSLRLAKKYEKLSGGKLTLASFESN